MQSYLTYVDRICTVREVVFYKRHDFYVVAYLCQRYPYPLICCSVYKEYILICLQPFEGETTSLRVWYLRYGNSNVHFIQPIPTPPVDRMNRSYSEIVTAPTHSYSCTYNKSSLPSDLFPSNSFPLNWQCLPILKNPPHPPI